MFGNNSVTSSWANPQNNQQQGTSAFGQPSAFGGGGAFGQPQQQQQPQQPAANPMFGNFGAAATNPAPASGFGAFNANTTGSASNPLFGGAKPTTGFGAFGGGGTSTFGSTGGGAFGSTANTGTAGTSTGLFGQPSTSTFGSAGGGLFGNNKPANAFGAPAATSATGTYDGVAPVSTGSSNPPFNIYTEKDPNTTGNVILNYHSISAMPAYRGTSFEEIRYQDYQQGRKTAGAFGQSATFGTATAGAFGQPAQTATAGANPMFGGNAFGSNTAGSSTTGGFGGGAFGQTGTAAAGGGLFGSGSAFGQPQQQQQQQQQQPTTGFGAFGQNPNQPQQQQGAGLFGTGGAFGQQNKPATGFGTFGGTGAFGQQQPQPQQQTATGIFGQTAPQTGGAFGTGTGAFGPPAGQTNAFGQPANPQPTGGFGAFGQNQPNQQQQAQPQQGGLFGGGGTGLFGQNATNQQSQPFGARPGGSLFGNSTQQTQPGTGLFGGAAGGGLFGNNNQQPGQQQQQQPAQTGLFGGFGTKPATTTAPAGGNMFGGFGQSTTNNAGGAAPASNPLFGGGNTFGQSTNQQPQSGNMFGGGGGLFGSKPAAPSLGFGLSQSSTQPNNNTLGNSMFGNSNLGSTNLFSTSATVPGASGTLTASITQPIGSNLPIFSMLPPGPRSVALEQGSLPKKKASYFVDMPTRSPVPRLQLGYQPATTKLRGFASSTSSGALSSGNPFATSLSGNKQALLLGKSSGPDAFLRTGSASPTLGSGGKQSVKKLILDKKVEPSDLFGRTSSSSPGTTLGGTGSKVTFSPVLTFAARERDALAAAPPTTSPTPTPNPRALNRITAHSTTNPLAAATGPQGSIHVADGDSSELKEGDYWMKPELKVLINTSHDELERYEGLVVGRVGYGEIHFLEPVDLTGLPKLGMLLGELVRFEEKECSVYPESEADKPEPGSGLNVRARIVLIRCWAMDKATREPIKDDKHPSAIKHLKRLKNMRNTHFEGFDLAEGKWTFTVDHF